MMQRDRLRIALIVSLIANAFWVAAFVAVVAFAAKAIRDPAVPVLRQAARAMDAPRRAAFVALMRADGRRMRSDNQAARTLRRSVWADFQAPAFHAAGDKAALAQARLLNTRSRAVVEDSLVDFAAGLPPDQRAALGRALLRLTPPPKAPPVRTPSAPASPGPGSSAGPRSPG
jgi:uncharacterized membrane protein